MNFIDKLIVKRANSIQWKEKRRKAETEEREKKILQSDRLFLRQCRDRINIELEKMIEQKMKEPMLVEIKAGDEAVVNIYNLIKKSRNDWDGGAEFYSKYIPMDDRINGVNVKITEVYLCRSLTDELVDRFLDKYSVEELKKLTYNGSMIWQRFCDFTEKGSREGSYSFFGRFGFYWAAKFETRIPFQPKWGLNLNSFFVKGEKGYEETIEIAKLEMEREKIQREKNKITQDLESRILQIKSGLR